MIKAIFFDSGNVLVKEGYTTGIAAFEKQQGIKLGKLYEACHDHQYWKDFTLGRITEKCYFAEVKNNFKGELDIRKLRQMILKNFISNAELLPYLKKLKSQYILGVISNNPKEWFEYCEKKFGWNKLFKIKAVSGYLQVRKPAAEIFEYAIKKAKIKGDEAIYVDDRPDRIFGGKKLGLNIVIYTSVDDLIKQVNNLKK